MDIFSWLPKEGSQILFVLFLSFLIGLEREEHKLNDDHFAFGGVRTYPLIGMIGYSILLISGGDLMPFVMGFVVIGAFLLLAYWHKVKDSGYAGVTSEMSALATYLVGGLVQKNFLWVATTLVVITMLLLSLKVFLEGAAKKIGPNDILAFTKFLLLSTVILPLLPNQALTAFQINPLTIWLMVVAVSGVSYASYVLQKTYKKSDSILWSAILGGIYSSTVTTVVLSKRSKSQGQPRVFTGAILIASGVMYLRLVILLGLFNQDLMRQLAIPFIGLFVLATGFGYLWSISLAKSLEPLSESLEVKNPLELGTAFLFGFLFVVMVIASHFALGYFGQAGVYTLAGIMGLTDVDPFVMSMTQSSPGAGSLVIAANAILIAAASNNLIKGVYAFFLSSENSRLQTLIFMLALSALGLIPIFINF